MNESSWLKMKRFYQDFEKFYEERKIDAYKVKRDHEARRGFMREILEIL